MAANPSSRFFWNDWENDVPLRLCSLAAQGLWMRMLCLAAKSGGYVTMDGEPCTPADLAKLVGDTEESVEKLINELEKRKIFSRNRVGTIYNRRMVREAQKSDTNRENGQKGGRVSRDNKKGIFQSLDSDAGRSGERNDEQRNERHTERETERRDERPSETFHSSTSPRSSKPNTPKPPDTPYRASEGARRIVARFAELRRELWPSESEVFGLMTLETQADQYLADGAAEPLCIEVIERVMRQNASAGKAPPSTLRFCRLSMQNAVANARSAKSSAITRNHEPDMSDAILRQNEQWRGRIRGFLRNKLWLEDMWGPSPLERGCQAPASVLAEFSEQIEALRSAA